MISTSSVISGLFRLSIDFVEYLPIQGVGPHE
jgi:hypothetical protein